MAAKKNDGNNKDKGKSSSTTASGKKIEWQDPKKYKSDTAIGRTGQKTTVSKPKTSDRFKSTAKTPVKKAGSGFTGSGGSLAQGLSLSQPTKKSNMVNAALTATALPGSGQVANWAAKKVGTKIGGAAASGAWDVAAKGLGAISSGGKVSKTFTPMGPTLRSTRIMSSAQKGAALTGLETRAGNIASAAGRAAGNAAAGITKKVVRNTVGGAKGAAIAGVLGSKTKKNTKKK